jgi:GNAT superfamily N-acetyltransferase
MIRRPTPREIKLLPQIENAADERYRRVGLGLIVAMPPHSVTALECGHRCGLLWVATSPRGDIAGFVLMQAETDSLWIDQLSVLDRWQRHGLGTALIDRSIETARELGYGALHLTTYRNVVWNEPFYRRRGFSEVPRGAFGRALRRVLLREVSHGHLVWQRALMRRVV